MSQLCEICPLRAYDDELLEGLGNVSIGFCVNSDDPRFVLHLTQGKPIEPAVDAYTRMRRSKLARKLASLSPKAEHQVTLLSMCHVMFQERECPKHPDYEYIHADFV